MSIFSKKTGKCSVEKDWKFVPGHGIMKKMRLLFSLKSEKFYQITACGAHPWRTFLGSLTLSFLQGGTIYVQ